MFTLRDLATAYEGEVLFEVHDSDGILITVIASNTAETLKDEVLDREVEKYRYVGNLLTQSIIVTLKEVVDDDTPDDNTDDEDNTTDPIVPDDTTNPIEPTDPGDDSTDVEPDGNETTTEPEDTDPIIP